MRLYATGERFALSDTELGDDDDGHGVTLDDAAYERLDGVPYREFDIPVLAELPAHILLAEVVALAGSDTTGVVTP